VIQEGQDGFQFKRPHGGHVLRQFKQEMLRSKSTISCKFVYIPSYLDDLGMQRVHLMGKGLPLGVHAGCVLAPKLLHARQRRPADVRRHLLQGRPVDARLVCVRRRMPRVREQSMEASRILNMRYATRVCLKEFIRGYESDRSKTNACD